jgi:hypothetical protein
VVEHQAADTSGRTRGLLAGQVEGGAETAAQITFADAARADDPPGGRRM